MMMKPILVRAFGRTGTTLLMQLLGSSKKVIVPNGYPYESRYLSYFGRMVNLMQEMPGSAPFTDGDVLDPSKGYLGTCPYNINEISDNSDLKKRLFQGLWNQFSQAVSNDKNQEYIYYAEKVALDLAPQINNNLPGVKNIFLTRDPRGELASIISFNKKRGFNGFGWLDDDTELSFAKRMVSSRQVYLRELSNYDERNENIIVLRFEDVVSNLDETANILSKFLNVEIDPVSVVNNVENMSHHMTSTSISDSRDKWRKELSDETITMFETEMYEELRLFNYI